MSGASWGSLRSRIPPLSDEIGDEEQTARAQLQHSRPGGAICPELPATDGETIQINRVGARRSTPIHLQVREQHRSPAERE